MDSHHHNFEAALVKEFAEVQWRIVAEYWRTTAMLECKLKSALNGGTTLAGENPANGGTSPGSSSSHITLRGVPRVSISSTEGPSGRAGHQGNVRYGSQGSIPGEVPDDEETAGGGAEPEEEYIRRHSTTSMSDSGGDEEPPPTPVVQIKLQPEPARIRVIGPAQQAIERSRLAVPDTSEADFGSTSSTNSTVSWSQPSRLLKKAQPEEAEQTSGSQLVGFSGSRGRLSVANALASPRRPSMRASAQEDAEECEGFCVRPVWQGGGPSRYTARASVAILGQQSRSRSNFFDQKAVSTLEESHPGKALTILQMLMIYPSSPKRLCWELCGLLLILYDCISIPLEVFDLPHSAFQDSMTWITRIFWSLNIPMSLLTGFLKNDGTVEVHPREVAKRYCLTWLSLDLVVVASDWLQVALTSFDWLGSQRLVNVLRVIRVIRIARAVRSAQAPEMTEFVNEYIRSEQVRLVAEIVKYMLAIVAVSHVMACCWYWIGLTANADPGGYGWIKTYDVDSWDVSQQYAYAFHWALSTFSGNLLATPTNSSERAFTICVILVTIIVSAALIGSLTTAMTRLQIVTSEHSQRLSTLRRYLLYQNITRPLAVRIFQNAQHALAEQKKNLPESSVELLQIISGPLLVELHFEIYAKTLVEHMFFLCYQDINPAGIKKVCHTAVSILSLSAGDMLFSNLEVPAWRRMFFVMDGRLSYKQEGVAAESAEKGQWLCEPVLWTHWTHCGTVKADVPTRLLELDAEKFEMIISTFPTDHAELYAAEFVVQLNMLDHDAHTDLDTLSGVMTSMIDRVFPTDSDSEEQDDDEVPEGADPEQESPALRSCATPDGHIPAGPVVSFLDQRNTNSSGGRSVTTNRHSRGSNDGHRMSFGGKAARASASRNGKVGKRSVTRNVRFQSVVGVASRLTTMASPTINSVGARVSNVGSRVSSFMSKGLSLAPRSS